MEIKDIVSLIQKLGYKEKSKDIFEKKYARDYVKFYIRFLIIRMNTILSNILKYRKTLILPRIYHD